MVSEPKIQYRVWVMVFLFFSKKKKNWFSRLKFYMLWRVWLTKLWFFVFFFFDLFSFGFAFAIIKKKEEEEKIRSLILQDGYVFQCLKTLTMWIMSMDHWRSVHIHLWNIFSDLHVIIYLLQIWWWSRRSLKIEDSDGYIRIRRSDVLMMLLCTLSMNQKGSFIRGENLLDKLCICINKPIG